MAELDNKNLEVVENNDNVDVSKWLGYKNRELETIDPNKQPQVRFTEEENKIIDVIRKEIDITKREEIINYGSEAQAKMTTFSENTLEKVKNKDLDDIGKLLGDVVNELKSFSTAGNQKGIVAFFKRKVNSITEIQTKYDSVAGNVDKIVTNLVDHQKNLIKDISNLEDMYEVNKKYYRDLSLYIEAGNKKIEDIKNNELIELTNRVNASQRAEDIQELKDLNDDLSKFEKKIHDLDLTRSISLQMAPQI